MPTSAYNGSSSMECFVFYPLQIRTIMHAEDPFHKDCSWCQARPSKDPTPCWLICSLLSSPRYHCYCHRRIVPIIAAILLLLSPPLLVRCCCHRHIVAIITTFAGCCSCHRLTVAIVAIVAAFACLLLLSPPYCCYCHRHCSFVALVTALLLLSSPPLLVRCSHQRLIIAIIAAFACSLLWSLPFALGLLLSPALLVAIVAIITAFCLIVANVTAFACLMQSSPPLCLFVAIVTALLPASTPSSVPTAPSPSDVWSPFIFPQLLQLSAAAHNNSGFLLLPILADLYRNFVPNEWLMVDCWLVVVKLLAILLGCVFLLPFSCCCYLPLIFVASFNSFNKDSLVFVM